MPMVFQSRREKWPHVSGLGSNFESVEKREKLGNSFLKWHEKQLCGEKDKESKRCCIVERNM